MLGDGLVRQRIVEINASEEDGGSGSGCTIWRRRKFWKCHINSHYNFADFFVVVILEYTLLYVAIMFSSI